MISVICTLLSLAIVSQASAVFERRNMTFDVPNAVLGQFSSAKFTNKASAISRLEATLGSGKVAYQGDTRYGATIARTWTQQLKIWPEAIVYPATANDVSTIMQFYSAAHTLWGNDGFAFMAGGHADFGGAQSPSVIIDLYGMGKTEFATDPAHAVANDSTTWPILKVGGGADGGGPVAALDGTGWAFLGPRGNTIGVGGFVLGGGICWQTSRYGVAADSLVGLEVVLINGTIVYANPYNEYSDLFWAGTGAGWVGVGVVTNFYSQAYPDPGKIITGVITWTEAQATQVFQEATDFFSHNTDPDVAPSLMYFYKSPTAPTALLPVGERQFTIQLNAVAFGGDMGKFNSTYGQFYSNASSITFQTWTSKSINQFLLPSYPLGFNRIYYGKSHTNSTEDLYKQTFSIYKDTVNGMIARGEDPGHTLWADQYLLPGLNGNAPATDRATAWPHATTAHITVSAGEWSNNSNTAFVKDRDENHMMPFLRSFQNGLGLGTAPIYDYPNFIAPYSKASEVWGEENFKSLLLIKQKYDPQCLFNRGRVLATDGCVAKGVANTSL